MEVSQIDCLREDHHVLALILWKKPHHNIWMWNTSSLKTRSYEMPTESWKSWLLKVGVVSGADRKLLIFQGRGGFTTSRKTASDPGTTWAESTWCLGGCCGKHNLLLPLFSFLLRPPLKGIRADGPSVWCVPATPVLLCRDLLWNWKSDWVRCRKDGRLYPRRENQSKLGTCTLKTELM